MKALCLFVAMASVAGMISACQKDSSLLSEKELEKALGDASVIRTIRSSTRVEAVRVTLDESPSEILESGEKVIDAGTPFDLAPQAMAKTKALFSDRGTYREGPSLCLFEPGVKLTFHPSTSEPVTLLVCLKCADISVVQNGKRVGFTSFAPGLSKVESLAQEIFPQDNDIRALIEERESERREFAEFDSRWRTAMPKSVQPLWDEVAADPISPNLKPLRQALLKELPDESSRILALLAWFGSGAGPWTGFPAYEEIPGKLLLEFPTGRIIAAIESAPVNEQQLEGAARLFGGWPFVHHGGNRKELPPSLKRRLLDHSLKSTDPDKIQRARSAFED